MSDFLAQLPPVSDGILLFFTAMLASAVNAVAGGGTFLVFPALTATGLSALAANVTSTIAVWPGVVASAWGYRNEISTHRKYLPYLSMIGLIGGWCGARMLLLTPEVRFEKMVPWLMLMATLLFSFGKHITRYTSAFFDRHRSGEHMRHYLAAILMFLIAIYGGFFGAGIGILMLAMLQCLGMQHIHQMNGLKTLLGVAINGVTAVTFLFSDYIAWPKACIMIVGALIGGYGMARIAIKIPQHIIRGFVICVACSTTIYYFIK
jgi:uncharacterized protein